MATESTEKSITEKHAYDVYYKYVFFILEGIVSTTEFQRAVTSRYKMQNSSLQETSINDNKVSNEKKSK